MTETFFGIDISKDHLDIAAFPGEVTRRFANTTEGIAELIDVMSEASPTLVAYEPMGPMGRKLIEALAAANIPAAAINPLRIRNFARALNRIAKTDRLDSLTIAEFAATMRPMTTRAPLKDELELHDLVGRRRQLALIIRDEKTRRAHAGSDETVFSCHRILKALKEEATFIDHQINEKIDSRLEWKEKRALLETFKGVGPVASSTLVADLPELGLLDAKKIASLVGLAPMTHESGEAGRRRRIKGGRSHVRSALFMAAIAAIRTNKTIKDGYWRLREANKPSKVAHVAAMRRILVILNAMARDGEPWRDPSLPQIAASTIETPLDVAE